MHLLPLPQSWHRTCPIDSFYKSIPSGEGIGIGFSSTIEGAGENVNRALYGLAKTERYNVGVQGISDSPSTSTDRNNGVYGMAIGEGTGDHRGLLGYAESIGKYNYGGLGISSGTGNGDTGTGFGEGSINFGVNGRSSGNSWNNTGVEGSNSGDQGKWNFGVHGISSCGYRRRC